MENVKQEEKEERKKVKKSVSPKFAGGIEKGGWGHRKNKKKKNQNDSKISKMVSSYSGSSSKGDHVNQG